MHYLTRQLDSAITRGQSSRSTGLTVDGVNAIGDALGAALRERDLRLGALEAAARANKGDVTTLVHAVTGLQKRELAALGAQAGRATGSTPISRTLARADSCLRS